MPKGRKTFVIEVDLTEKQVDDICARVPGDSVDTRKIAAVAQGALMDIADGGLVLDGPTTRDILEVTGPIEDIRQLVNAVEAGFGKQDGSIVVKFRPDPTYVPVLEETASTQGISVNDLAQGILDLGMANGWLYDLRPDTKVIFMDMDDYKAIIRSMGVTSINGTEIAKAILSQPVGK